MMMVMDREVEVVESCELLLKELRCVRNQLYVLTCNVTVE